MVSQRLARTSERKALAEFVRHCREHASPTMLGLSVGRRRRTTGLRREEVATLAGVGLTWYTWFEQGRDIQVSDDFLRRLANGLKLDRAAQEHLYALSGRSQTGALANGAVLSSGLVDMLEAVSTPAYILNKRWDVLAFNAAAAELFVDFRAQLPNMLRIVFFSDVYRDQVQDWRSAARQMFLKARHDCLTGGNDPILRTLLDDIMTTMPETSAWWTDPELVRIGDSTKVLRAIDTGWKRYQLNVLSYEDRPDIRIIVYTQSP